MEDGPGGKPDSRLRIKHREPAKQPEEPRLRISPSFYKQPALPKPEPRLLIKYHPRSAENKESGDEESPLLTRDIEFGDFGAGIGDLNTDGFEARLSGFNDPEQDAFAISADRKVFAVADGLGGAGAGSPEITAAWSRAVAEAVAAHGNIASLTDEKVFNEFAANVKKELERKGLSFESKSRVRSRVSGTKTTLSAVERIGREEFSVFIMGDSPVYVIDAKNKRIIRSYGEDFASGGGDSPMRENVIGMNQDGSLIPLNEENRHSIINEKITVKPGELLVIGSDYLSKNEGMLGEHIGLSPEDFHALATRKDGHEKDDATMIVIDPEKLEWKE